MPLVIRTLDTDDSEEDSTNTNSRSESYGGNTKISNSDRAENSRSESYRSRSSRDKSSRSKRNSGEDSGIRPNRSKDTRSRSSRSKSTQHDVHQDNNDSTTGSKTGALEESKNVAAYFQEATDRNNAKLLHVKEEAKRVADAYVQKALTWRQEHEVGGAKERLSTMGAFTPFLLLNVSSRTTDALLYFNAMQSMLLCLHSDYEIIPYWQKTLLHFLESIGIDGRLLQELSSLPCSLSETSGEFLLHTGEYNKWVQQSKTFSTPEPLSSCLFPQVISRVDMERALTALVDLASVAAVTGRHSIFQVAVMRFLHLLNAISRRHAKQPLQYKELHSGLSKIMLLKSTTLQKEAHDLQDLMERKKEKFPTPPNAEMAALMSAFTEPLMSNTAIYATSDSIIETIDNRIPAFAKEVQREMACRCMTFTAFLMTLVGFVPDWLSLTGIAVGIACLLCHPASEEINDIQSAAVLLLFAHDIGLSPALLSLAVSADNIFPWGDENKFVSIRTKIADTVKANVGKVEGDKDLKRYVRKITEAPLKAKLLLFLQGLPSIKKMQYQDNPFSDAEQGELFASRTLSLMKIEDDSVSRALKLLVQYENALNTEHRSTQQRTTSRRTTLDDTEDKQLHRRSKTNKKSASAYISPSRSMSTQGRTVSGRTRSMFSADEPKEQRIDSTRSGSGSTSSKNESREQRSVSAGRGLRRLTHSTPTVKESLGERSASVRSTSTPDEDARERSTSARSASTPDEDARERSTSARSTSTPDEDARERSTSARSGTRSTSIQEEDARERSTSVRTGTRSTSTQEEEDARERSSSTRSASTTE